MLAADSKVVAAPTSCSSQPDSSSAWKRLIEPVEPFLETVNLRLFQQVEAFDPELRPFAEYALNAQGKHLRPALVGLTADALGTVQDAHATVAVIIEMVHLATLVHDDVMDEAQIRRGDLTVAARWGNDLAVLFGDCLFAQALTLAASFPTPDVCRAVAMATNTVCSGEILQTRLSGDFRFTREQYFRILEMKTAELFALSCQLSAFLSGAKPEKQEALRQFGLQFGTAYQVYDDCMDLFGSEAKAGKSLGTDLAKGKLTLPFLVAWDRAGAEDRARLKAAVQDWRPDRLATVVAILARHGALEASVEVMGEHLERARKALSQLLATPGRDRLLTLTEFLAKQTDSFGVVPDSTV